MISQKLSALPYIAVVTGYTNKKDRAIADPAPNHNEHIDEFDLR